MIKVSLYTKPDCCLCDEAQESLERVRKETPFQLEEIDIRSDPALLESYAQRIPVVLVNGAVAFEYRVDESELRRLLVQGPQGVN